MGDPKDEQDVPPTNIEIGNEPEDSSGSTQEHSVASSECSGSDIQSSPVPPSRRSRSVDSASSLPKKPLTPTNSLSATEPHSEAIENADVPARDFQFDPDSYIYMANACCELLHYRVAAYVVGGLEVLLLIGWVVFAAIFYNAIGVESMEAYLAITGQSVIAFIAIASISMMVVGVSKEKPFLLWPHMIFQMLGIGLGIVLTVISVVSMAAGTHIAETVFGGIFGQNNLPLIQKTLGPIWPFCLAVIFDFGAAIGIWYYILVRGAYDYLLDKKFFEGHSSQQVVMKEKGTKVHPVEVEQIEAKSTF